MRSGNFRTLIRNLYDFHRKEILAALINEYTDWDNPKVTVNFFFSIPSITLAFNLQIEFLFLKRIATCNC